MDILSMENLAVSVTFWSALAAMAAFVLQLGLNKPVMKLLGQLGMGVALVGSLVTLILRAQIAQHAPWSNLWESMITVMFGSLSSTSSWSSGTSPRTSAWWPRRWWCC